MILLVLHVEGLFLFPFLLDWSTYVRALVCSVSSSNNLVGSTFENLIGRQSNEQKCYHNY